MEVEIRTGMYDKAGDALEPVVQIKKAGEQYDGKGDRIPDVKLDTSDLMGFVEVTVGNGDDAQTFRISPALDGKGPGIQVMHIGWGGIAVYPNVSNVVSIHAEKRQ